MTRAARRLCLDGHEFRWTRRHGHDVTADGRRCVERLCAWLVDHRRTGLTVRFVDGHGGHTTAGEGYGGHDGGVLMGSLACNLNRPAVAAALVRAALAVGWDPRRAPRLIDDGFDLLRRALAPPARRAARTAR